MNRRVFRSDEPREHVRFAAYLNMLEQVADAEEADLISEIFTDEHEAMAQSAVLRHLDRRAAGLCLGPDYTWWVELMVRVMAGRPFLIRRLEEWSLFRALSLGEPWNPDMLTGSSNWLQLKIAENTDTTTPLALLAEQGRTKRIRNAAKTNLKRLSKP